jgi:hypothetical protein
VPPPPIQNLRFVPTSTSHRKLPPRKMSAQTATQTTQAQARGSNRGGRRGNRGRGAGGARGGRGGRGGGKGPESTVIAQEKREEDVTSSTAAIPSANVDGNEIADTDPDDVCFICAEPVKYYSVSACNHRTCHVCSLRLRALYKKLDCTFCKVREIISYLILSIYIFVSLPCRSLSLLLCSHLHQTRPGHLTLPMIFHTKIQNSLSFLRRKK